MFKTQCKFWMDYSQYHSISPSPYFTGEHPAAMQRGKNAASPIPGRWWGPLSAGLGFSTCLSRKSALTIIFLIEVASHIILSVFT